MAIKKDMKAWAVKLRGRNFWLDNHGTPWIFSTKKWAEHQAKAIEERDRIAAEPIRVRVRIEEIE